MPVAGRPELIGGLARRFHFFNPDEFKEDFSQRLLVQKVFYLLQEGVKVPLGYTFNWYHHGPYSPALAKDFYNYVDSERAPDDRVTFKDKDIEAQFGRFISWVDGDDRPKWLELLASTMFLRNLGYPKEIVSDSLHRKIPALEDSEFESAWTTVSGRIPPSP